MNKILEKVNKYIKFYIDLQTKDELKKLVLLGSDSEFNTFYKKY